LGAFYFLLFLAFFIKIIRHYLRPAVQRKSNKQLSFFVICIGLCGSRIVYHFSFPYLHGSCAQPTIDDSNLTVWDVLTTFPSALFYTAFSVNIHALAVVYHLVAKAAGGLWVLITSLVMLNLVVYSTLVAFYLRPDVQALFDVQIYTTSATEFIMAVLLVVYARLIYQRFVPPNPMQKLWRGSLVCFLCFLLKAVLIVLVYTLWNRTYSTAVFFVNYFFTELIPMGTMLLIFEGPRVVGAALPMYSQAKEREATRESSVDSGYYVPVPPPPEPEVLLPRSATMSETINSYGARSGQGGRTISTTSNGVPRTISTASVGGFPRTISNYDVVAARTLSSTDGVPRTASTNFGPRTLSALSAV
jgi:hypothetical protein